MIVPSHTAVATAATVVRAGAVPVFADIDPDRFTISPEGLRESIAAADRSRLKAAIVVHLYGQPADMESLLEICQGAGIWLFEDCAQAHGATLMGRHVGVHADGGSFSFYPTKNLGAIGDGGAVVTGDPAIDRAVRELRQYGWRRRYISEAAGGINSRLDEMQAAILRAKLPTLPEQISRRRKLAALYRKELSRIPEVRLPAEFPGCEHAYHLYVIRAQRRDALLEFLTEKGIPAALHYPAAVHQQPAYADKTALSPALPRTESVLREILTLPLHSFLSEKAVEVTSEAVREFFTGS